MPGRTCPQNQISGWSASPESFTRQLSVEKAREAYDQELEARGLNNVAGLSAASQAELSSQFAKAWRQFVASYQEGDLIWQYKELKDIALGWREGFVILRGCSEVAEMTYHDDN